MKCKKRLIRLIIINFRSPPRKSSRTERYLDDEDENEDDDDLLNRYDYINGEKGPNTNS